MLYLYMLLSGMFFASCAHAMSDNHETIINHGILRIHDDRFFPPLRQAYPRSYSPEINDNEDNAEPPLVTPHWPYAPRRLLIAPNTPSRTTHHATAQASHAPRATSAAPTSEHGTDSDGDELSLYYLWKRSRKEKIVRDAALSALQRISSHKRNE